MGEKKNYSTSWPGLCLLISNNEAFERQSLFSWVTISAMSFKIQEPLLKREVFLSLYLLWPSHKGSEFRREQGWEHGSGEQQQILGMKAVLRATATCCPPPIFALDFAFLQRKSTSYLTYLPTPARRWKQGLCVHRTVIQTQWPMAVPMASSTTPRLCRKA